MAPVAPVAPVAPWAPWAPVFPWAPDAPVEPWAPEVELFSSQQHSTYLLYDVIQFNYKYNNVNINIIIL